MLDEKMKKDLDEAAEKFRSELGDNILNLLRNRESGIAEVLGIDGKALRAERESLSAFAAKVNEVRGVSLDD